MHRNSSDVFVFNGLSFWPGLYIPFDWEKYPILWPMAEIGKKVDLYRKSLGEP